MKHLIAKMATALCVVVLCAGTLVGCLGSASNTDSSQQSNRTYMSKVNSIMDQLGEELSSFVAAVSRGDLVNMRTQADNAYRSLDDLSQLDVPEDLKDVQQNYLDGTAKLREALNGYIDLYTEVEKGALDESSYAAKLADIQSKYDEGVELLKKGDETAAGK